jgi:predicted GIY-YIG superfamily endonuclease
LDDSSILYRHFDAHGRLLYVGVAVNPQKRLRAHASEGAKWVTEVARSTYERFRTHKEVLDAEIMAIQNEAPLWNIVHADAGRLRVLRRVRVPKGASNATFFSMPAEPCFAWKGTLVSFRTQGRAEHFEYKLLNDHCHGHNYQAVVEWIEWFGYHYEHGCVSSEDGSFCATWDDVLRFVNDDWYYEFVVRPKLGLESDSTKMKRPLWKCGAPL